VVKLLLDKGADVESRDANYGYGQTPLSLAAKLGHQAVVKMLLEKGADAECRSNGNQTPLLWARNEAIMKLLLEKGSQKPPYWR
jgi:ankyrin repeat protein